jgi:hypothetical protein
MKMGNHNESYEKWDVQTLYVRNNVKFINARKKKKKTNGFVATSR